MPACGNPNCDRISYDGSVYFFGSGYWSMLGEDCFWTTPCWVCAQAYLELHPEAKVWPAHPPRPREKQHYKLVQEGLAPWCGHNLPHLQVKNPTPREREFIKGVVVANHMDDIRYKLRSACGVFLQCDTPEYIFLEFWSDDTAAMERFVTFLNENYPCPVEHLGKII